MFVEQPLASPGSANYSVKSVECLQFAINLSSVCSMFSISDAVQCRALVYNIPFLAFELWEEVRTFP